MADDWLRALRCPLDGAALERTADALRCEACRRSYPVRCGIPDFVAAMPSGSPVWIAAQRYELAYWERAGQGRLAEQQDRFRAAAKSLSETFDRFANGALWRRRVLQVGTAGTAELHHLDAEERYAVEPLACELKDRGLLAEEGVHSVSCMGEHLPFPEDHFSLALIPNVIDHTADPARVLAELLRCLRPDGLLWLSSHVSQPVLLPALRILSQLRIGYFAGHPWYFSGSSLRGLTESAGFEVLMQRGESVSAGAVKPGLRARLKSRLLGVEYLLLAPRR